MRTSLSSGRRCRMRLGNRHRRGISCGPSGVHRGSGRQRPGRSGGRQAPGSAVAQRLLEVGDRADDLVERKPLAARVGESLTRQKPSRFVLMAPTRRPALEQAVVDGCAHPLSIGNSLTTVESLAEKPGHGHAEGGKGGRGARKAVSPPRRRNPGGQAVSHLWGEESRRTRCIFLTLPRRLRGFFRYLPNGKFAKWTSRSVPLHEGGRFREAGRHQALESSVLASPAGVSSKSTRSPSADAVHRGRAPSADTSLIRPRTSP